MDTSKFLIYCFYTLWLYIIIKEGFPWYKKFFFDSAKDKYNND